MLDSPPFRIGANAPDAASRPPAGEPEPAIPRGRREAMSDRPDSPQPADAPSPAAPADATVKPAESTVGTGSSLGIGCMVVMLILFLALAVVFFLPYLRR